MTAESASRPERTEDCGCKLIKECTGRIGCVNRHYAATLADAVENCRVTCKHEPSGFDLEQQGYDVIIKALRAYATRSESKPSAWIPVSERKPEARYGTGVGAPAIISDDVLVFMPGLDCIGIANYDHEENFWTSSEGGVWAGVEPTHWMPLPEDPK